MYLNPISLIKGVVTYIPGVHKFELAVRSKKLGTASARYCYSVWLRHLSMAHKNGLPTQPDVIAELGPGASLGIGLAALISGASQYYALDVVEYSNQIRNLTIFDELIDLFEARQDIPDNIEFPEIGPALASYKFPSHILTDERLGKVLKRDRIESIRAALLNLNGKNRGNIQVSYFAPWYDSKIVKIGSVDMIYSQAVLEHVNDLIDTYEILYHWLRPGGFMSHQIDFRCHRTATVWNGHWAYSDFVWKLIQGKRGYLLNRQPHSTHLKLLQKFNFEIVCDFTLKDRSGIQREALASKFKDMSEDDLTTSTAFIQAVKRHSDL